MTAKLVFKEKIKKLFSYWKNLSFSQKFSVGILSFFLLALPISVLVVMDPVKLFTRATYPLTPPITPPYTSSPSPTPIGESYRVFVTSTFYNANLGGLSGADAKCQERANTAGLGGIWKAWLSDGTVSASSRLVHSSDPYVRLDGVVIADNWDDLTDGNLDNPIRVDEKGNLLSSSIFYAKVWTNTKPDGLISSSSHCNNWTSGSASTGNGLSGIFMYTDGQWTRDGSMPCSVTNTNRLYCFEQPLPDKIISKCQGPCGGDNASQLWVCPDGLDCYYSQPNPTGPGVCLNLNCPEDDNCICDTPTPSPTPVPEPNNLPRISTWSLSSARVNRYYRGSISGYDMDKEDELSMYISNLPPGLSKGSCTTRTSFWLRRKTITCQILGTPTKEGSYRVDVALFDSKGGVAEKSYLLNVRRSFHFPSWF